MFRRPPLALFAFILVVPIMASANDPSGDPVPFDEIARPLVAKYCLTCHDALVAEGDIVLTSTPESAPETWKSALRMLTQGEMPPASEPRPGPEDHRALVGAIRRALAEQEGSARALRRLNWTEYDNTIRDLLGVDLGLARDFPVDDTGYGFDNIADVLTMSPLLLERYLDAAEKALDAAIVIEDPHAKKSVRRAAGDLPSTSGGRAAGRGHYMTSNGEVFFRHVFPVAAKYMVRLRAFGKQAGPDPARMELRVAGRRRQTFDVEAVSSGPEIYEATITLPAGIHRVAAAFVNDYYRPQDPVPAQRDRNLYIDWIEVVGPIDLPPAPKPESHRRIFTVMPNARRSEEQAAKTIVAGFARRAWRRPVEAEDVARLLDLFTSARSSGDRFEEAVKEALTAALVSPRFLFMIEPAEKALSDYEVASRLSYFLWKSMPDEELFELAKVGRLRAPGVLEAQASRMLSDPRASALTTNFAGQWLELRNLDAVEPDATRFPQWNAALRDSMRRETELFFGAIVRHDRPVTEFLDSDYTWLDERLATHYGIEGVEGNHFRPVALPDGRRGGVLTHASILTITSNPTRTSPVKRGKWILEQILGTPPPPPPPEVPPLPEGEKADETASLRDRLASHIADPTCASCHTRMDPLGFAFENFDAIGRWRESEGRFPIDATGTLPDGTEIDGPADLRRVLSSRREAFVRTLAERLVTYALGRGLLYDDAAALDRIVAATGEGGDRFSSLIEAIVRSESFLTR